MPPEAKDRILSPWWTAFWFALLAMVGTAWALRDVDLPPPVRYENPVASSRTVRTNVRTFGHVLARRELTETLAGNFPLVLRLGALVPWGLTCFLVANGLLAVAGRSRAALGGRGAFALLAVAAIDLYLVVTWSLLVADWRRQYLLAGGASEPPPVEAAAETR